MNFPPATRGLLEDPDYRLLPERVRGLTDYPKIGKDLSHCTNQSDTFQGRDEVWGVDVWFMRE